MSGSVNKVTILGNLGSDPDIRHTQDGNAIANLSVATSDSWTDKNSGERRTKTEWHRVVIFGPAAKVAGDYLRKGSKAYFEGSLQTRRWQDRDGNDRYTTEVVLQGFNSRLVLLDAKPRDDRGSGDEAALNAEAREAELSVYDSDLPF